MENMKKGVQTNLQIGSNHTIPNPIGGKKKIIQSRNAVVRGQKSEKEGLVWVMGILGPGR